MHLLYKYNIKYHLYHNSYYSVNLYPLQMLYSPKFHENGRTAKLMAMPIT